MLHRAVKRIVHAPSQSKLFIRMVADAVVIEPDPLPNSLLTGKVQVIFGIVASAP